MTIFDPNAAAASNSGVFGLPFSEREAALVYLPVPWEATTSYGGGTSDGPNAILAASRQVDLFDLDVLRPYEAGMHWLEESKQIRAWNERAKTQAQNVIGFEGISGGNHDLNAALTEVNALGESMNVFVFNETLRLLEIGKIVGVVGGDHSVPFGAIQAMGTRISEFGLLHFDAHCDMRNAFEGFTWSHASILRNVLERTPAVTKLVQVGIRDFCEEEWDYCRSQGDRVVVFFDAELARRKFQGENWAKIAKEIVKQLPQEVWVTFDIDGLDPRFCPHTGTPVPGGLDFHEAVFILEALVRSGRTIVGFDLNEVAPDPEGKSEWDGNVGARLLYKLSAWTLASQGKREIR